MKTFQINQNEMIKEEEEEESMFTMLW